VNILEKQNAPGGGTFCRTGALVILESVGDFCKAPPVVVDFPGRVEDTDRFFIRLANQIGKLVYETAEILDTAISWSCVNPDAHDHVGDAFELGIGERILFILFAFFGRK